jgi:hypothetical protein
MIPLALYLSLSVANKPGAIVKAVIAAVVFFSHWRRDEFGPIVIALISRKATPILISGKTFIPAA